MKNNEIDKAIRIAGSQKALGKKIGRAQSTVCDWLHNRKRVAPEVVPILVDITGGEVKGYEFRPDLPTLFPHPDKAA
ncbi:transcriptional regulator [Limnobaculum xujianqingii]|uniref:transcriptional regulator n=1 Tax=Limnobaculum xujianqingii TaxID=2738837 RepID=UPI0011263C4D|nr:YdaS family helix-turn-helix protein [Limnobaculum xujianqingii]